MELLGLLGVLFLLYLLIVPLVALLRSGRAQTHCEELAQWVARQSVRIDELETALRHLQSSRAERQRVAPLAAAAAASPRAAVPEPLPIVPTAPEAVAAIVPPASAAPGFEFDPEDLRPAVPLAEAPRPVLAPVVAPPLALDPLPEDDSAAAATPAAAPAPTPAPAAAVPPRPQYRPQPTATPRPAAARVDSVHDWTRDTDFDAARNQPPAGPSLLSTWIERGREWLFGGNLVARIGLLILFIGVAFLLRLAANYVTVPIEFRLAGVAAGALALLVWGFRIRIRRPGIALSVQGAALATLMLVTFAAFRIFNLLPAGAAFALLFALVSFTCVLAVLQDALWLAIFGIVGGFAVPILLSTGGGSHIALFSYYAILNAGILVIALKRDWRLLNVLGFLFTFAIGTAWGLRSYQPEHYQSTQAFLGLFFLFYVAIAIVFAWRRAPQLKSYVDGTLVFGVPTVGMGLQAVLVRPYEYGMALSALALGLFYAITASVLWHLRRQNLKLLVESFFALAVVFGTLTIPLAFDDRWTSAAWALEGAGIVWVGLRQRQPLVWRFGVAVQVGSWLAFLKAWYGLDPLSLLEQPPGFGMLLLGASGVFLAWLFRREEQVGEGSGGFAWLAGLFLIVAAAWLLGGMWIEVWRRVDPLHRVTLLVLTGLLLVLALQQFGRRLSWRLPERLGNVVVGLAGIAFVLLAGGHAWATLPASEAGGFAALARSGFFGGLLLSAGALVSALAFHREDTADGRRSSARWFGLAVFWWCAFALRGLAAWLSWLSRQPLADGSWAWYAVSVDALYAVGLGLSAASWTWLARWRELPFAGWMQQVFRPLLSAVAVTVFLFRVGDQLLYGQWLDFDWVAAAADTTVGRELLGGPLVGGLIFVLLALSGLRRALLQRASEDSDAAGFPDRALWLGGLVLCALVLVIDPLALAASRLLLTAAGQPWLHFADLQLLGVALLVPLSGWLASRWSAPAIAWLGLPAAVLQALASLFLLAQLHGDRELPAPGTALALLGLWLALDAALRRALRQQWTVGPLALRVLHFGRVIAPALMLVPVVALNLQTRLFLPLPEQAVTGSWPWYLGLWAGLGALLLLLRQVPRNGWPLAPLGDWYGRIVLPLAAGWALWTVLGWNLTHDGRMAPLPYLPLLNPLDLSSAFVALALAALWRLHAGWLGERIALRRLLLRIAAALAWLWFNLMLLRSAAVWLELPYDFNALYGSQVVQAMLSLVWTLAAFVLMRFAAGRLSRGLWMVGATALAVVVVKLFVVDLSSVGTVARTVSFMGVGGLMLLIGYLAPLPAAARDDNDGSSDGDVDVGAEKAR